MGNIVYPSSFNKLTDSHSRLRAIKRQSGIVVLNLDISIRLTGITSWLFFIMVFLDNQRYRIVSDFISTQAQNWLLLSAVVLGLMSGTLFLYKQYRNKQNMLSSSIGMMGFGLPISMLILMALK